MEPHEKQLHVSRIAAGIILIEVGGRSYTIRPPTLENRYISEEIYGAVLKDGLLSGLMSDDDLSEWLLANGFWSEQEEKDVVLIEKDIKECKVNIFKSYKDAAVREQMRFNLAHREDLLSKSFQKRHIFDHLTATGLALSARYKYLTGCSIFRENGKPLWKDPLRGYRHGDCTVIDKVITALAQNRISSANMRELARTNPWRETWVAKKYAGYGVFGKAAVDLTDEQRSLYLWSFFYDNIYQNPDRPSETIINDDPACDGFQIIQSRKINEETEEKISLSARVAGHDEVFVPLVDDDTGQIDSEKAEALDKLNSPMAKAIMRSRFNKIEKQGVVNEIEFGDVQNKLRQQIQDEKDRRGMK